MKLMQLKPTRRRQRVSYLVTATAELRPDLTPDQVVEVLDQVAALYTDHLVGVRVESAGPPYGRVLRLSGQVEHSRDYWVSYVPAEQVPMPALPLHIDKAEPFDLEDPRDA